MSEHGYLKDATGYFWQPSAGAPAPRRAASGTAGAAVPLAPSAPYDGMTIQELRSLARERGIHFHRTATKVELVKALVG